MKTCTRCKREFPATPDYFQKFIKYGKPKLEARCKQCKREQNLERYKRDRLEAFIHYSDGDVKCACCSERNVEFLSIDHIDGGGTKHRKEYLGRWSSIALWLKHNNYPEGFRVLCMNCNTSLGFHGYCPHNKEKNMTDNNA